MNIVAFEEGKLLESLRDEVIAVMKERPSLKNRASSSERIITKIKDFINTFIEGMG